MDVHTYNPLTTALENIFRRGSAAAGFPLLSPSWASCLAREDNSKTDDDDSNMAFVSSVRKLSIRDQQESSDEEDESQQPEADDREPCMWSAPPARRIPGPAPWTAGHNLLREWEEGATNTRLAPRARAQQADTHSSPLDSYLHFLTRHT